jgi:F-type H+-transporting ATPase subunit delta
MDSGLISTRYAKAIYQFAAEHGEETRLFEEMNILSEQFFAFPALKEVMENPTISFAVKEKLLISASGGDICETGKKAFGLIVGNGRANYMQSVALMYAKVYRREKNIVQVKLTTVELASKELEQMLIELLAKDKHETVNFSAKIDADVIGGFILEVDDLRLDASVRNQLNQMKLELTK